MPYKAFISYSHAADGKFAPAIQSALHRFAKPFYRVRALQVFRDKADLSANPALWPVIQKALGESEYFLLLASPDSARSLWVNREIDYWLEIHQGSVDKLLILWTDGELVWDSKARDFAWERTTALPRELSWTDGASSRRTLEGKFKEEPFYLDERWAKAATDLSLRNPQFLDEIATLAATLHGKPKSEMIGEDVSQHRRYKLARTIAAALVLIFAAFSGVSAIYANRQKNIAQEQGNIAETNRQMAENRRQEAEDALGREKAAKEEADRRRTEAVEARDHEKSAREAETKAKERTQLALKQETIAKQQAEQRRLEAERQSQIARSRQLAAEAGQTMGQQANLLQRGSLLAIEAQNRFSHLGLKSLEADQVIRQALALIPHPLQRLPKEGGGDLSQAVFSPNRKYLVARWDKDSKGTLYLWDINTGQEVLRRPCDSVCGSQIAVSSDGRYIAGLNRGSISVLEVATGRQITRRDEKAEGMFLSFSPDGRYVASSSGNYHLQVWDTSNDWKPVCVVFQKGDIESMTFSPDGRYLVTSGSAIVRIWEIAQGDAPEIATLHADTTSLAFTTDGHYLATGGWNGTIGNVKLWDARANWKEIRDFPEAHGVSKLDFSLDGRYLAVVSGLYTARVWNLANGQEVSRVISEEAIDGIAFSPDGRHMATASWDSISKGTTERIWLTDSGREVGRITNTNEGTLKDIAFTGDGRRLAIVSGEALELWEATGGDQLPLLDRLPSVNAVAFSPDGRYLAVANSDSTVVYDATRELEVLSFSNTAEPNKDKADERDIKAMLFSPRGKYLALSTDAGRFVRVWDLESKRQVASLECQNEGGVVAFSPDERYLIMGGQLRLVTQSGDVRIFDSLDNWKEIGRFPTKFGVTAIALSPNGAYLLLPGEKEEWNVWAEWNSANAKKVVAHLPATSREFVFSSDGRYLVGFGGGQYDPRVFDIQQEWRQVSTVPQKEINDVAISPDGRYLATAGFDNIARVWKDWNTDKPKEISRVIHEDLVYSVIFSPDGNYVVSLSTDKTIRVWEAESGREVARINHDFTELHRAEVGFSPDGKYLAFTGLERNGGSGTNKVSRLYMLRPDDLVSELCSRLTRNLTPDELKRYLESDSPLKTCPRLGFER
jgi:WD40 repeat protein